MRILKEDSIALVIDFQERLMPVISDTEVLKKTAVLLEGLNALEVPSLVTRQYPRGLGETVDTIKAVTKNSQVYDKISFSCYDDTEIKQAVNSHRKNNVIICGVEAHICVLQTIIDLQSAGYQTIFVEDCISSRFPSDKATAIKRAEQEGTIITSCEAILFELTRAAGSDTFKKISALIK